MNKNFPVLLAENNPDDIFLVKRAFRKAGLLNDVIVVQNGMEAIAYLEGRKPYEDRENFPLPGLMLLDLKMPFLGGLEVLAWIRGNEVFNSLLVVVLTHSQQSPDINRAYHLGANSYLVKPCNFEGLVQMMKTIGGLMEDLNVATPPAPLPA
jgi:CheY-like chemotaxis protein